jgi:hypothetical protein
MSVCWNYFCLMGQKCSTKFIDISAFGGSAGACRDIDAHWTQWTRMLERWKPHTTIFYSRQEESGEVPRVNEKRHARWMWYGWRQSGDTCHLPAVGNATVNPIVCSCVVNLNPQLNPCLLTDGLSRQGSREGSIRSIRIHIHIIRGSSKSKEFVNFNTWCSAQWSFL